MIYTNSENITALVDALYVAKRDMQSTCLPEFTNPVFVLVCKDETARLQIESRIMAYLCIKFGFDIDNCKSLPYDVHPLKHVSAFRFPNEVTFALITLSQAEFLSLSEKGSNSPQSQDSRPQPEL